MTNLVRCSSCGAVYRKAGEITQAGGSCKQIGLALFGLCVCGGDLGGYRPGDDDAPDGV